MSETPAPDRRYPVLAEGLPSQIPDIDPEETAEWLESLDEVVRQQGPVRARYLMLRLLERARERAVGVPSLTVTDYVNTIPTEREPWFPGNEDVERRIRAYIRWNAAIMVSRANRPGIGVGGHIATYASSASLYEVGFNHFFRGKDHPGGGDQVFIQGHASPGIYARAFLEGRLTEDNLDGFRQESLPGGLPSYPHPRLMPGFWEFPTVSMGLGPLDAIYQARFNRYLHHRGIKDTSDQHVWAFTGDGEMDEPESLGAIGLAAREELDNLTFVVNCNLQRLDGPVRGNGKVIQELEAFFRGAGWNVIKVVWGRGWDPLLAQDVDGVLVHRMNTTPDGQFQTYSVEDGAYIREHFFGGDPRLRRMVKDLSNDQIRGLPRGGHDYRKIYAAFDAAVQHQGQPTAILAHTIKGWTLGKDFEGRNATHQMKKLTKPELKELRDRLYLEIPDSALEGDLPPYYHPGQDSEEIAYMRERRAALGGELPRRVVRAKPLPMPSDETYAELAQGSGKQGVATTMAFVRLLKDLMKDKAIGARFVPIVPDEARTFGMDSLFPSAKIYSPHGQKYEAVDRNLLLSYKESETGQILHEGITEAGSMGSAIAVGTSYSTHGEPMIPIYIFYSMFGFQRTGDSMWAMTDALGRGFLLGATAGRTTLNGEGLQHQDGHSLLLASTNPAIVSYDPAWAYEVAVIVRSGLERMFGPGAFEDPQPSWRDVAYYLTVYNEPMPQPARPAHVTDTDIIQGLYRYAAAPELPGNGSSPKAQIVASGVALPWALHAQHLLASQWGVAADVWSAPSWGELRRDGLDCDEHALLHPEESARVPLVSRLLDAESAPGPIVGVSDWMRSVPDQIAPWIPDPSRWTSLGTDGFGRSDTRAALRRHFHVDAESIVVAVLHKLAATGEVKSDAPAEAISRYQLRDDRAALGSATEDDDHPVSG
ncbi:MAG TPA: pyruvate dehydrogenase (acetyl-transferring), homodimeric type [Mycobacteriales bacterium]|nr:pyruvate dehydrogenase (acetyl-transferring), homodimeric type [Mycobacteriales bacterium]